MGELFQQGSSSLARSRAHQSHSAITGAMGLQPLRTAVQYYSVTKDKFMCFLPQTGLAEPYIAFITNLPVYFFPGKS